MPSDPSLLAGMQNLTICWWTLWFLTNLLVDTGPNKIFISGLSRREKHGKCPFCPWLFLLPWSPSSGRDAVLVSEPRPPLFPAGGGFPAAVAHTCPRRGGAAARARRRGHGGTAARARAHEAVRTGCSRAPARPWRSGCSRAPTRPRQSCCSRAPARPWRSGCSRAARMLAREAAAELLLARSGEAMAERLLGRVPTRPQRSCCSRVPARPWRSRSSHACP